MLRCSADKFLISLQPCLRQWTGSIAFLATLPQNRPSSSNVVESFKNRVYNEPPRSLRHMDWETESADTTSYFRQLLLKLGGYYSKESTFMRSADSLYSAVREQAGNPKLFAALVCSDDFQHQHALLCLHVWLLLVRLRSEGSDGRKLSQLLYDNFQDDIEARVRAAGVKVRLSNQLTELEKQFYGSSIAYDKAAGLTKSSQGGAQETLANALFRNVFQANPERQASASVLERYVKRELACLSMTDGAAVMAGNIRFSPLLSSNFI